MPELPSGQEENLLAIGVDADAATSSTIAVLNPMTPVDAAGRAHVHYNYQQLRLFTSPCGVAEKTYFASSPDNAPPRMVRTDLAGLQAQPDCMSTI